MNYKMTCNVKNKIVNRSRNRHDCQRLHLKGKKSERLLTFISFFFLLTIAMSSFATAATYYVDANNGNDSGSGSSTNPWRTVDKAKSSVYAGDTVNLRSGDYGSVTFTSADNRGNSGNRITYQNDPGNAPYSAKFTSVNFNGIMNGYLTIAGVDVQNTGTSNACIKLDGASHINIFDCKAHGEPGAAGPTYANILCASSNNVLIEDCEVYHSGASAFGIQMQDSDTVTARGNHVHDIVSSGVRTGGGQNYIIDNNIIHDQREDWNPDVHGSGISIHSHNTTISNNIVYNFGNTRPIMFYHGYAGANGYRNMLVENNLVYRTPDFTGKMWWVQFVDVGPNVVIRNNTFTETMVITFASNEDGSGLTLYNNVVGVTAEISNYSQEGGNNNWHNITEGGNCFRWLAAAANGYRDEYDQFSATSDSIVGQAVSFASQATHYPYTNGYPYQLANGSIAIDLANANYAPATDMFGNGRIGEPDAGCYEFGSGSGIPVNDAPVANAGQNQTVTDNDNDGIENITLNGSGSTDSDGTITSYIWKENGNQIASGVNPTVPLETGPHTITLTVTDNDSATDSDDVNITIDEDTVDLTPPDVVSFSPSANSLEIVFSEALNPSSAENVNNYQIDPAVTITQASLNTADNTVTLTTSTHTLNDIYTVTCSGISDLAGNIAEPITKDYIYSPNLVGFWHFDEGDGLTAQDLSSEQNAGLLVNDPQWTEFETLDFDGIDDHVTCGNDQSLNLTGDLTIGACLNLVSFGQNGWGRIVDKGNGSNGFSFFVEETSGSIVYVVYGGNLVRSNPGIVELNKWQHVAAVFNNSAKTVTFYLDGEQVGSSSYATAPTDSAANPLVIGIRSHDLNRAFDGQIDNVRLYNKALNDQDVLDMYSSDYPTAFYPIGNKTVDENATLNFEIKTFSDGIDVQLETHNLPSQPQLQNNVFNWTPAKGTAGSYDATFYAAQGQIEDFETITITVNSVNSSPVFNAIGDKSVNEGQTLTFDVNATDQDNDTITYSATSLPSGAAFNGNTFNWTPQFDQAGTYMATFTATDGQETVSQTITITVNNANRPPVLNAISDKSVTEKQTLTFAINATDADNDAITYSANGLPNGATLTGNTFNWTPQIGQAGLYQTTFAATDGYATVSKTIEITVEPAPVTSDDVIIDNGDPQTSYTGAWSVSGGSNPYSDNSLWARDGAKYTWTFKPSVSGQYDLAMWWSGWASRTNSAQVTIEDMSGTDTTTIDQSRNAGQWNTIDTYDFQAGSSYKVTITATFGSSSTCADAVKFTRVADLPIPDPDPVADVIIDNGDSQTSYTGTWSVSGGSNPYDNNSLWARDGATYTWTFTPSVTGQYDLAMWWSGWASRSNSVKVAIQDASGTDTTTIDQSKNSGQWNSVTACDFQAGNSYKVTITATAGSSSTCADAVKFSFIK